ncbi:transporter substrate-binding domain-containing protein [Candidatus Dependentiae bacterium]|nr:transporter substrate-binding domain-containing protein [Candidatus Dependentiae bacterium]
MKVTNYVFLVGYLVGAIGNLLSQMNPDCGAALTTFVVATQLGIPPYEFIDEEDNPAGFDIALACELGKRLDFESLMIKHGNANDPRTLNEGNATIMISALNEITPLALSSQALVKYADFSFSLLFKGKNPERVTAENALGMLLADNARIGVIENSNEARILDLFMGITIINYPDVEAACKALNEDEIHALFSSSVIVNAAGIQDAELTALDDVVLPPGPIFDPYRTIGLGIAISFKCRQLYTKIKGVLNDMVEDGTYESLAIAHNVPVTFTPVDLSFSENASLEKCIPPIGCGV